MSAPQAIIYDMDGLIIDSEPLWREVEIASFNAAGISLTESMCAQTKGLRTDEVTEYWLQRYPETTKAPEEIERMILETMPDVIRTRAELKPGVRESLDFFRSKGVPMALASTSFMKLIDATLDTFALREYFSVLHSSEFEQFGKPHPGVYITTAQKLAVPAIECVAIEDSMNGVLAAKAAKMKCIAVPERELIGDRRLAVADVVLDSLTDTNEDVWARMAQ